MRISIDLNYRVKLWTTAEAGRWMSDFMQYCDVLITTEEDIERVFGMKGKDYEDVAGQVARRFPVEVVAITLRESLSASDNGWSAVLWDGATATLNQSQRYQIRLVDRIGGGDSFAAGLIHGLVTGRGHSDALRFAVAASALKQTIPGDFNRVSVAEVDALAAGDASGRVRR